MPVYDYECKKCGKVEVWHSMSETKEACPLCGELIKKIPSRFTPKFNGPGFYVNDSRSGK